MKTKPGEAENWQKAGKTSRKGLNRARDILSVHHHYKNFQKVTKIADDLVRYYLEVSEE